MSARVTSTVDEVKMYTIHGSVAEYISHGRTMHDIAMTGAVKYERDDILIKLTSLSLTSRSR